MCSAPALLNDSMDIMVNEVPLMCIPSLEQIGAGDPDIDIFLII